MWVKVKLSRNISWRLRGWMESWASIITVTLAPTRTADLSALYASRCLPPKKFLDTHFCFRPSEFQGGQKDQIIRLFPRTLSEIEPGTSLLGVQCLIKLHPSPVVSCVYVFNTSEYVFKCYFWPSSWSSGQSPCLLIMRFRIRFPDLPWEFSLKGRIPAVAMVWVG